MYLPMPFIDIKKNTTIKQKNAIVDNFSQYSRFDPGFLGKLKIAVFKDVINILKDFA
jgi:hypothetical protein